MNIEITEENRKALEAEYERGQLAKRALDKLNAAKDKEYLAARERDFNERILGRLFFKSDPSQGIIELVRPTGCTNFGSTTLARQLV